MMKTTIPILLLLTLTACSGASTAWVKKGANEDQVSADQLSCRRSAERATSRNDHITSDIRSSIPGGRQDTRAIVEETRNYKASRNYDRLFARCMRGLGYTHPKT